MDSPVSWTVPSNSTPVDPQGPPRGRIGPVILVMSKFWTLEFNFQLINVLKEQRQTGKKTLVRTGEKYFHKTGFPLQAYRTKTYQKLFKFQNSANVDWLVLPYYAKKLTCDELFILIREYTRDLRGFTNLFSICACSPGRFGTIRAKWKTCLKLSELNNCNQLRIVTAIKRQKVRKLQETCMQYQTIQER